MSKMSERGVWSFLPYLLPVIGGAVGMFWARYGSETFNPVIAVVIGVLGGRVLASAILHLADRAGWRE